MNKEEIYNLLDKLDLEMFKDDLYKVPLTWCELYDIRDYINSLEQENKQLKEEIDKYKRLIEYIKSLDFYEFELDYDYEENQVNNYYPADMEYHINNWLEVEKIEKGDK